MYSLLDHSRHFPWILNGSWATAESLTLWKQTIRSDIEIAENKSEQYTRRNNIEIQGIPSTVNDKLLDDKVIEIFSQLNFTISKSDIEDCHRLGKANPKNTIVWFVLQKFRNKALEKKKKLMYVNKTE